METRTRPSDVGDLNGFDAGDHDVIRRVLAETLLARITARCNEYPEQRDNGEQDTTTDHGWPM